MVIQAVQVVAVVLHVLHLAVIESQASQVRATTFPNVPSGHVLTQVVPDRNSKLVFPHFVHLSCVTAQATHSELQSTHVPESGSFPSLQVVTQALFCK